MGDDVEPDAKALITAGESAAQQAASTFLHVVHLLAREQSGVTGNLSKTARQSVGQWRFQVDPKTPTLDALAKMTEAFTAKLATLGVTRELLDGYEHRCRALQSSLPAVLARIRLDGTFGLEDQVKARAIDRLSRTYPLSRDRIVDTIWGNMRAFVDDVAVRRGQWIERRDLDGLIVRAWPDMMVLREPPPLPSPFVDRSAIVERIVGAWPCRATEIVGVAGSGKTSLARATYDHVRRAVPRTTALYAEVRRDRTFREVLTALAFHLAPNGSSAARDAVAKSNVTEEQRATEVAQALTTSESTVLLVDLVEGDCSDDFARLLARFLSSNPPENCSILLFGHGTRSVPASTSSP